jgi:hypothetical protein
MRIKMGYRRISGIALTVMLAALIGGLSLVSTRADDYGDGRGRDVHQERDRGYAQPYHRGYYESPYYVYAPPPVYYAPPPQQPVIDFVFPLNIR